uniref:Secreted protein n=1 Tax=Geobacter sp. (strain M21) TaxID=443144 RepID=C6E7U4_GEOSM
MKNYRGKLVMAAIILSCGLVMQVEQSERVQLKQDTNGIRTSAEENPAGTDSSTVAHNVDSSR